jgi:hypothetical protein
MDKTDQLLVRACKSEHPLTRVASVYRRQYLQRALVPTEVTLYMCGILTTIVDKYCPMSVSKVVSALDPHDLYADKATIFHSRVLGMLISHIRYSEAKCFPGLTPPLKFRNPANGAKL